MGSITPNFNLFKPDFPDPANIVTAVSNNMDILDGTLGKIIGAINGFAPDQTAALPPDALSALGNAQTILNWYAALLRQITGESDWFTPPPVPLSGKVTGQWTMYDNITQLGLTRGQETVLDIIRAMPVQSTFIGYVNAADGGYNPNGGYPEQMGTLTIVKHSEARCYLDWASQNPNTNNRFAANYYDVTVNAPETLSAWAQVVTGVESGTWTPTLFGATAAGSVSLSAHNGAYMVIGPMVYLTCQIQVSAVATAPAGDMMVGGLPFAPNMGGAWGTSTAINVLLYTSAINGVYPGTGNVTASGVRFGADGNPNTRMQIDGLPANFQLRFSGWYRKA